MLGAVWWETFQRPSLSSVKWFFSHGLIWINEIYKLFFLWLPHLSWNYPIIFCNLFRRYHRADAWVSLILIEISDFRLISLWKIVVENNMCFIPFLRFDICSNNLFRHPSCFQYCMTYKTNWIYGNWNKFSYTELVYFTASFCWSFYIYIDIYMFVFVSIKSLKTFIVSLLISDIKNRLVRLLFTHFLHVLSFLGLAEYFLLYHRIRERLVLYFFITVKSIKCRYK